MHGSRIPRARAGIRRAPTHGRSAHPTPTTARAQMTPNSWPRALKPPTHLVHTLMEGKQAFIAVLEMDQQNPEFRPLVTPLAQVPVLDVYVAGLTALEECERNGRTSVVGGVVHTNEIWRKGAEGERGSVAGGADGGYAASAANDGASEAPAFVEEVGEGEEEMWALALATLEEDEQLEMERVELDDMMLERASMHTIPDDIDGHVLERASMHTIPDDIDGHVNENTLNDPGVFRVPCAPSKGLNTNDYYINKVLLHVCFRNSRLPDHGTITKKITSDLNLKKHK
eukprot:SAG11_NODE_936_length_6480_cov_18.654600_3_plen_285_part_00